MISTQDTTFPPLVPGRELDALIAENVMGWEQVERSFHGNDFVGVSPEHAAGFRSVGLALNSDGKMPGRAPVPTFSTDLATAWQIVDRLEHVLDFAWTLSSEADGYCFRIFNDTFYNGMVGRADTVIMAICRAAVQYADQ